MKELPYLNYGWFLGFAELIVCSRNCHFEVKAYREMNCDVEKAFVITFWRSRLFECWQRVFTVIIGKKCEDYEMAPLVWSSRRTCYCCCCFAFGGILGKSPGSCWQLVLGLVLLWALLLWLARQFAHTLWRYRYQARLRTLYNYHRHRECVNGKMITTFRFHWLYLILSLQ